MLTTTTTTNPSAAMSKAAEESAWGVGVSQTDLMERDTVLVVNNNDEVIGSASKRLSHVFDVDQPHGILHRAFSVFLFDRSDGRLLVHQRAAEKITFPNVWTNTCCSHPLHGMTPSEVDNDLSAVRQGQIPGILNAARRKLQHELGWTVPNLQTSSTGNNDDQIQVQFLTRLHYWAADTVTHGPASPWGEHEIDYVVFMTVPDKDRILLQPHPDEIQALRWVTSIELQDMLSSQTDQYLFSPWFRIIYDRWLKDIWWTDLNVTMTTTRYCDYETIHCFDPPVEHWGGAGQAQPMFVDSTPPTTTNGSSCSSSSSTSTTTTTTKTTSTSPIIKQGAYGKVRIHQESKWKQLLQVDEVWAAITLLYLQPLRSNITSEYCRDRFAPAELAFCDEIVVRVSRSFAAVIRQLPGTLLVDVLVFYLVLRALDTIEDDTKAFASQDVKIQHLITFVEKALSDPSWSMDGVGEGDERRLLEQFPKCHCIYQALPEFSRQVIADIAHRMAVGMAEFVHKDLGQGVKDIPEYDRYCHFVAGLVGVGLSRLAAGSGLEQKELATETNLSNQMGLFLQKTNIIRDYLEDYVEKRAFWPQSVWKKYSASGDLGYFVNQDDLVVRSRSVECLNELITNALELVPDCLIYLSRLRCPEYFRFCAIPQAMAIATLDKCYANPQVFTGVVKIRKGLSCKLILRTNNLDQVYETFYTFSTLILTKAKQSRRLGVVDRNYFATVRACETIQDMTRPAAQRVGRQRRIRNMIMITMMMMIPAAFMVYTSTTDGSGALTMSMLPPQQQLIWTIPATLTVTAISALYWNRLWSFQSKLHSSTKKAT